jgi:hypothetical protein
MEPAQCGGCGEVHFGRENRAATQPWRGPPSKMTIGKNFSFLF